MIVSVMDLRTRNRTEYTCDPRSAVIAAHAQDNGDWNTWDYETHYGSLVQETEHHVFCVNHGARKESTTDDR